VVDDYIFLSLEEFMRRYVLVFSLILASVFNMRCDDGMLDLALLSAFNDGSDKSQVIIETIGEVGKQLIAEGKAQIIKYEGDNEAFKGKTVVVSVEPYTMSDLQYELELALNSKLGNTWQDHVNRMLNNPNLQGVESKDIPEEFAPVVGDDAFRMAETDNIGWVQSPIDFIYGAEACAKQEKGIKGFPTPWGWWWLWGITWFSFDFHFIDSNVTADQVSFKLYDANHNLYTFTTNNQTTVFISNCHDAYLETPRKSKDFGYIQQWTTRWEIVAFDSGVSTSWIEEF